MTDEVGVDIQGAGLAPVTPALAEHVEAVAQAAEKITSGALAEKIEAWFVDEIHNSPVSRAGSEVFNHLRQAVDNLKIRLAAI